MKTAVVDVLTFCCKFNNLKNIAPCLPVGSVDRDGTNYNMSSLSISSTSLFWAAAWRSLSQWNSKTWKPGIGPLELQDSECFQIFLQIQGDWLFLLKMGDFICELQAGPEVGEYQVRRSSRNHCKSLECPIEPWEASIPGPGPWWLSFTMSIRMRGHDQNFTNHIHSFRFVLIELIGALCPVLSTDDTLENHDMSCGLLPGEFPEGHWGEAGGAAPHLREGTHGRSKTPGGCPEQRREHGTHRGCRSVFQSFFWSDISNVHLHVVQVATSSSTFQIWSESLAVQGVRTVWSQLCSESQFRSKESCSPRTSRRLGDSWVFLECFQPCLKGAP